ncbi:MAG: peptide chain release factor 2 [Mariprofundaceae bacterium]|nr:peptide chain release factor 2 [Mariprofundaceae bacterium]
MDVTERLLGFSAKVTATKNRIAILRGRFDIDDKEAKLSVLNTRIEDPDIWNDSNVAKEVMQEKNMLERTLNQFSEAVECVDEQEMLFEMSKDEGDQDSQLEAVEGIEESNRLLGELEMALMLGGENDFENAFLDINPGAGGTEAQDWADMLLRMYLRWAERRKFKVEIIEYTPGEEAGIKSASLSIKGAYAFGLLKAEIGIHRLVRKSPFDSGNRRHTSFASIFSYPDIEREIEIEINESEVRVDTYRASGAGGQHINKTDSAVRLTHEPTNIVVQCQNNRSQHKNRAQAWKMLKARLYEHEMSQRDAQKQELEDTKSDIGWGQQIRSYVLDQSRIKDLRTGMETGNTQAFLDGDIDSFIQAQLMGIKRE